MRPTEPDQGLNELLSLASRNRFVRPRIATSQGLVTVGAGTAAVFASFYDNSSEGIVLGFSFWESNENYAVTPVTIGQCGADSLAQGGAVTVVEPWDVLTSRLSPRSVPFFFPESRGYYFKRGRAAVLALKNTSAVDASVEGVLFLLTWNEEDRKQAISMVKEWKQKLGPAFPEPLFAGGAR